MFNQNSWYREVVNYKKKGKSDPEEVFVSLRGPDKIRILCKQGLGKEIIKKIKKRMNKVESRLT